MSRRLILICVDKFENEENNYFRQVSEQVGYSNDVKLGWELVL